ncbi:folylpolyglutamate synthase/dihydrofolate synthase family protein [Chitinophaga sp. Cy-1792]|uniref:bifunctional folylpolyglutamate synthase/dihydrofolate synthase n=1 Tax=Chitinophaga sp. Cy-1792 TaxID=2608339 RepID=UPI00142002F1|nr:folylpolyglutamate synthase/dihydrofolate synthase family protein [Chitinophaga sp. Cy-1792]NIG54290.1 bifunctional folylpolyglutamate synthase/dihydrofolate synthase [Chitinophaga sp. Cy-1792]
MQKYQETLDFLFAQLPMFTKLGESAFKKDLDNTIALLNIINNPHQRFKSIHVAGTNGKGSSSHMLAAIFQQAGYKTGLYTSPHLLDFRERIKIDGKMISEDFVVDFTEKMKPQIAAIQPSFFELTVAMAFEYFAQEQVDIAIIEVGLGGRIDSTNVITPEVSLITNISYDHKNLLGDTLALIAGEKAGIIKPGIPAVISERQIETKEVFIEKAAAVQAPLAFADERWMGSATGTNITNTHLELTLLNIRQNQTHHYKLDLNGQYQEKNVMGVLTVAGIMQEKGWNITQEHITTALSHVKKLTGLRGRWEVVNEHPLTVYDVGHNEAGITEIMQQLRHMTYTHLHIVTGFVKDKEVDKVLPLFPSNASYYFSKAQIPRALDEVALTEMAAAHGLEGKPFSTVQLALQAAKQHAQPDDMILVCGSCFIVADAL